MAPSINGSKNGFAPAVDAAAPHAPAQTWIEERTRLAVGPGINVSGHLIFTEPVRIEGWFRGEVASAELVVISDRGRLEGNVKTPRLLVLGELRGDALRSRHVVLGPRARVCGRIDTESLTICEGAHFEGEVRMTAARRAERNGESAKLSRREDRNPPG